MASEDELRQADADWEAAADEWERLTGVRPRLSVMEYPGFRWLLVVVAIAAIALIVIAGR